MRDLLLPLSARGPQGQAVASWAVAAASPGSSAMEIRKKSKSSGKWPK